MTHQFDLEDVRLLPLGGAKDSTHGDENKPEPEDEETSFQPL
jgi:hypothetical protein